MTMTRIQYTGFVERNKKKVKKNKKKIKIKHIDGF